MTTLLPRRLPLIAYLASVGVASGIFGCGASATLRENTFVPNLAADVCSEQSIRLANPNLPRGASGPTATDLKQIETIAQQKGLSFNSKDLAAHPEASPPSGLLLSVFYYPKGREYKYTRDVDVEVGHSTDAKGNITEKRYEKQRRTFSDDTDPYWELMLSYWRDGKAAGVMMATSEDGYNREDRLHAVVERAIKDLQARYSCVRQPPPRSTRK